MISSEDSNNVNPTNGQLYTLSTGPLSASQSAAGMVKPMKVLYEGHGHYYLC